MKFLRENNYRVIGFGDAVKEIEDPAGGSAKCVVITRRGIGTDRPSTLNSNRSDVGIGLIINCREAGGQVLPRPFCSISGRGCCSPDLARPSPSCFPRATDNSTSRAFAHLSRTASDGDTCPFSTREMRHRRRAAPSLSAFHSGDIICIGFVFARQPSRCPSR
jgi:hypothetical protein